MSHEMTAEEFLLIARERLRYEPHTGRFFLLVGSSSREAGNRAGGLDNQGYRKIRVAKKLVSEHRLAWAFIHGRMPPDEIDHINGDRADNRIENLRLADRRINTQNTSLRKDNRSGFAGATARGNRWMAQIKVNGKAKMLGMFDTPEEASRVYIAAKRVYHPGYARQDAATQAERPAVKEGGE